MPPDPLERLRHSLIPAGCPPPTHSWAPTPMTFLTHSILVRILTGDAYNEVSFYKAVHEVAEKFCHLHARSQIRMVKDPEIIHIDGANFFQGLCACTLRKAQKGQGVILRKPGFAIAVI